MVLTNEIDGINVNKQDDHRVLQGTNVINFKVLQLNEKSVKHFQSLRRSPNVGCALMILYHIIYKISFQKNTFCLTCNSHVIFSMGKVKIFLYSHSYDQLPASLARGCSWPPLTTGFMSAPVAFALTMVPAINCDRMSSSNTSIEGCLYSFFIVYVFLRGS